MSTQAQIAQRAYDLWEKSGRPHGKHVEHWLQAETELSQPQQLPAGSVNRAQPLLKTPKSRRIVR